METRKTKSGWVILTTNMVHGCLEQGGVSGREVLYTRETLARHGIDYDADPTASINEHGTTIEQYLRERATPDRVLKAGDRIQ